ncbi:PAS domain-containing protein [Brevundimonas sp. LF-1]|uniref:PAS domain-containing protein n=1 Tax=Brevundimonas sp. LF-1 TaxID=3126100 RepID=UPI0030DFD83F
MGAGVLAEQSPAPTWVVDGAGRLVWANSAWLAETGAETLAEARERGSVSTAAPTGWWPRPCA